VEVAVVDDARVEELGIGHDNIINTLGNQSSRPASLGVDISVTASATDHRRPSSRNNVRIQVVNDGAEILLGLLVEIGDSDTGSQNSIVGVLGGKIGSRLGGKVVELDGRHAIVDTSNNFFGDPEIDPSASNSLLVRRAKGMIPTRWDRRDQDRGHSRACGYGQ
jgi:hypothetical protein